VEIGRDVNLQRRAESADYYGPETTTISIRPCSFRAISLSRVPTACQQLSPRTNPRILASAVVSPLTLAAFFASGSTTNYHF
jgi:hypothetical protein